MATDSDNVKTPPELVDETQRTAREALQAAQGYAQESARMGRDAVQSIRSTVEGAKETGSEALDTTGKAYAQHAVNATGRKLRDWKGQVVHVKESCAQYVADQPVRSSLIAAAGGAVLMALLLSLVKRRAHDET